MDARAAIVENDAAIKGAARSIFAAFCEVPTLDERREFAARHPEAADFDFVSVAQAELSENSQVRQLRAWEADFLTALVRQDSALAESLVQKGMQVGCICSLEWLGGDLHGRISKWKAISPLETCEILNRGRDEALQWLSQIAPNSVAQPQTEGGITATFASSANLSPADDPTPPPLVIWQEKTYQRALPVFASYLKARGRTACAAALIYYGSEFYKATAEIALDFIARTEGLLKEIDADAVDLIQVTVSAHRLRAENWRFPEIAERLADAKRIAERRIGAGLQTNDFLHLYAQVLIQTATVRGMLAKSDATIVDVLSNAKDVLESALKHESKYAYVLSLYVECLNRLAEACRRRVDLGPSIALQHAERLLKVLSKFRPEDNWKTAWLEARASAAFLLAELKWEVQGADRNDFSAWGPAIRASRKVVNAAQSRRLKLGAPFRLAHCYMTRGQARIDRFNEWGDVKDAVSGDRDLRRALRIMPRQLAWDPNPLEDKALPLLRTMRGLIHGGRIAWRRAAGVRVSRKWIGELEELVREIETSEDDATDIPMLRRMKVYTRLFSRIIRRSDAIRAGEINAPEKDVDLVEEVKRAFDPDRLDYFHSIAMVVRLLASAQRTREMFDVAVAALSQRRKKILECATVEGKLALIKAGDRMIDFLGTIDGKEFRESFLIEYSEWLRGVWFIEREAVEADGSMRTALWKELSLHVEAGDAQPETAHILSVLRQSREKFPERFDLPLAEIKMLAPPGGAILIPIIPEGFRKSQVAIISREQAVIWVNLPATDKQVAAWVRELRAADADCFKSLPVTPEKLAAFNAVLLRQSQGYWDALIGPVCDAMRKAGFADDAPLTILPRGEVEALPLHIASWVDGDKRKFLIGERIVRYAPSARALSLMKQRTERYSKGERRLLAYINPTGDLTEAGTREADALDGLNWDAKSIRVGEQDASLDKLLADMEAMSRVGGVSFLHLAAHGFFNLAVPQRSGVVFTKGSDGTPVDVLETQRVLGVPKFKDLLLVTSAACDAGKADVQQAPHEYIGLATAFLVAGAASVLSATYSVFDRAAATIMSHIYREMIGTAPESPVRDVGHALHVVVRAILAGGAGERPDAQSSFDGALRGSLPGRLADQARKMSSTPTPEDELHLSDWAAYRPICSHIEARPTPLQNGPILSTKDQLQ